MDTEIIKLSLGKIYLLDISFQFLFFWVRFTSFFNLAGGHARVAEAVETVPVHEIYGGWPALSLLLSHPIRALAKEVQFLWPLGMVKEISPKTGTPQIPSHKRDPYHSHTSRNSSRNGMGVWEWDLPLLVGGPWNFRLLNGGNFSKHIYLLETQIGGIFDNFESWLHNRSKDVHWYT